MKYEENLKRIFFFWWSWGWGGGLRPQCRAKKAVACNWITSSLIVTNSVNSIKHIYLRICCLYPLSLSCSLSKLKDKNTRNWSAFNNNTENLSACIHRELSFERSHLSFLFARKSNSPLQWRTKNSVVNHLSSRGSICGLFYILVKKKNTSRS